MKNLYFLLLFLTLCFIAPVWAQDKDDINEANIDSGDIFDDRALLEGYYQKYADESKDICVQSTRVPRWVNCESEFDIHFPSNERGSWNKFTVYSHCSVVSCGLSN